MASEIEMLDALLEDERVSEKEQKAFEDMKNYLAAYPKRKLSEKQRKWVESRFEGLDLGAAESLNLVSSGKVPKESYIKDSVTFPWEKPEYKKPLKPPR
jgi:hypothetical protein